MFLELSRKRKFYTFHSSSVEVIGVDSIVAGHFPLSLLLPVESDQMMITSGGGGGCTEREWKTCRQAPMDAMDEQTNERMDR